MKKGEYPLSLGQKDFYRYAYDSRGEADRNHMLTVGTGLYDDSPAFDPDALEKAYYEVLRRNDAFRMRISGRGRYVNQIILDAEAFPRPRRVTLTGGMEAFQKICDCPEYPDMTVRSDFLTEAVIYRADDGTGGMIVWQHHICTDGYSTDVIAFRQICEFYDCFRKNTAPPPARRQFSYLDYIRQEKEEMRKNWKKHFSACWHEYNHHLFRFDVPVRTYDGETEERGETLVISGERCRAFAEVCAGRAFSDTNAFVGLLAALVFLSSPVKRFPIFSEVHGHMNYAQKHTGGAMLTEVPAFFEPSEEDTLAGLVTEAFHRLAEAYRHFPYSNELLDGATSFFMRLFRLGWRANDNWLVVNNLRSYRSESENALRLFQIPQPQSDSGLNLEIFDAEPEEGIRLSLRYDEEAISREKVLALKNVFIRLLDLFCANPDITLRECAEILG